MRLTAAWAETVHQNTALKVSLTLLTVACIALSGTIVTLALKEPVLIDRGCVSEAVKVSSNKKTDAEVRAFVEAVLQQRFDTAAKDSLFLSEKERAVRDSEQKVFAEKEIAQKLIVRSVTVSKDKIEADTDRLISVGRIRSAFSFPVSVELASTARSESNPYGLILSKVEELKKDEKK